MTDYTLNLMRVLQLLVIFTFVASMVHGDDIVTKNGVTYSNAKVTSGDVLGVKITHKTGVAFVPFAEMTDTDKSKYGYDPKKEEALFAEKRKQKEAAEFAVKESEKMSKAFRLNGTVIQVLDEGIIFQGKMCTYTEQQDALKKMAMADKLRKQANKVDLEQLSEKELKLPESDRLEIQNKRLGESIRLHKQGIDILSSIPDAEDTTCIVAGIKERLADNEEWKGYVYYAGIYKYINTQGANKTIRAYATTQELADKIFK